MVVKELQFSFLANGDGNITRDSFTNPSLNCGGGSLTMSTDIVFSNSDGSVTASALVEKGQDWMNGLRTANGLTYQLSRSTTNSVKLINTLAM